MSEPAVAPAAPAYVFHCPACCPVATVEARGFDAARRIFEPRHPAAPARRGSGPLLLWLALLAFALGYLLTSPDVPRPAAAAPAGAP